MMTAAGGAVRESLDRRFTNEATMVAGKCLSNSVDTAETRGSDELAAMTCYYFPLTSS